MAFNIWDFEKKGDIKGKLIAKIPNLPPFGKSIYGIEMDNGETWYIWSSYVLVGKIATLPFMTTIKIRYLGKGREKESDKHDKKLFDVTISDLPKENKKRNYKGAETIKKTNIKK